MRRPGPFTSEALTQVASALDVDVALYNGTNTQPWPRMFAYGNTVYLITHDGTQFNGTGTAGNVWIYTAPRYV